MILIAPLLAAILAAQSASVDDTLRRQLSEFLTAASHAPASAGDKRIFDAFFADDVIYTRASGIVIGKADIMRALDEPPAAGTPASAYSGEDVKIVRHESVVIVAFRLVQRLSDGTVNRYRNTGTFAQRGGRWQAIAWQATRISNP